MIRPRIRRLFTLALRRRGRWERDVDDEIMLHLSLRAEQLAAQGMAAPEARDEAIRRFGPLHESRAQLFAAARDREDQMRHSEFIDDLRQDITFAVRSLRRQKGWTTVAITTLALGIAATTAVWSAASALLLHPLPYPHANRVVVVEQQPTVKSQTVVKVTITPSMHVVRNWREHSRSFEAIEPYRSTDVILRGNQEGARLASVQILPTFASFTGQHPLLGQNFADQDMRSGAPVVLLGEGLWRSRFGGDARVIGSTIVLDNTPRRVVGVMPSTMRTPRIGGQLTDVWVPLDTSNVNLGVRVVGRLRPGVTMDQARRELDSLAVRSGEFSARSLPFVTVITPPSRIVSFRDSLLLLAGAVALVLLVACANVAHLMLARAVVRGRELAIRSALGAARSRLLRQLLTESVILTGLGATLGVALGFVALKVLIALRPTTLSELRDAHLDWLALSAIVGLSVVSGLVFGLVAAFGPRRGAGAVETLKAGAISTSPARRGERLRSLLVVTEMAMSAMLLVGATLLVRTVVNLQHFDVGFQPQNLYAVQLDLPASRYATPAAKNAAIADVQGRLAPIPGIRSTAISDVGLGQWKASVGALEVDGEAAPPADATSFIPTNAISPGFFKTVGGRIVEGRTIVDTSATSGEVVINAGFARRHWRGAPAVGHRIRIAFQGKADKWMTIVGVVADISALGPTPEQSTPVLYVARAESENPALFVRTTGSSAAVGAIMAAARSLHPELPPVVKSAEAAVSGSIAAPRFIMMLLASFTALALILASVGLYGVMAYAVAQRTREIGIRMALGASGTAIARTVIARGALLAGSGAAIGLALAFWGTRIIQGSLFGVSRLDVPSFIVGAAVLVFSAVVACVAPTRRAVAVDPIRAIRAD